MDSLKIIGAHGKRRENDFYPTPWDATAALCEWLDEAGENGVTVWEPACGNGSMVKVLEEYGYNVYGTDIQTGTDFLAQTSLPEAIADADDLWIITNPPFSLAEEFIRKAHYFGKPFAMLLKCQYWHSAKRLKLFRDTHPAYILPLTWRPDFTGGGNSLMDMMWVVWNGCERKTEYEPLGKPKARRQTAEKYGEE